MGHRMEQFPQAGESAQHGRPCGPITGHERVVAARDVAAAALAAGAAVARAGVAAVERLDAADVFLGMRYRRAAAPASAHRLWRPVQRSAVYAAVVLSGAGAAPVRSVALGLAQWLVVEGASTRQSGLERLRRVSSGVSLREAERAWGHWSAVSAWTAGSCRRVDRGALTDLCMHSVQSAIADAGGHAHLAH